MSRSPSSPWLPLAVFLLTSQTGCADRDRPTRFTVRDSAGIEIAESTAPAWPEGEGWRLSPELVLTIGLAQGAEEYELYDVASALQVGTGEVAVACGGTNQVRFYDSTGAFLRAVGRAGSGPGEYRLMWDMWRMGSDSLALFDYGNARMTVMGARGEFGRTFALTEVPGRALPIPVGPFADGSFLGASHDLGREEPQAGGVFRGAVLLVRWSPDGDLLETQVLRPGDERFVGTVEGRPIMRSPPFAHTLELVTSDDVWYYGSTEAYEIEQFSPGGELRRILRRTVENRLVTPEMETELERWAREQYADYPAPILDFLFSMPVPETTPAHGNLIVDDDGNLWVSEYRLPTEEPSWAVFDPDGRFLGVLDTPAGGEVTQIGSDYLLGIWRDELDAEQVRKYRIIKGG
jgi:hypothetical protein